MSAPFYNFTEVIDLSEEGFSAYVKSTCWWGSPPHDPGCVCHRPKGHEGDHACAAEACGNSWAQGQPEWLPPE